MSLPDKDTSTSLLVSINGELVDTKDLSKEDASLLLNSSQTGTPVYNKSGGGYTTNQRESAVEASVALDKSTGAVKIKAPQTFLDSDYYKNNIQPTLKSISQRYRENPDVKQDLQMTDEDGNEITKTMEDYIRELNEGSESSNYQNGIQKLAEYIVNLHYNIDDMNDKYGFTEEDVKSGKGFNESNMMRARQQVYNYGDITHADSDLQALPNTDNWKKFLASAFALAGVSDAYDEESGTITREGWREFFNRDKNTDERLQFFISAVEDELADAIEAKDADRIADAQSILGTIEAENPDVAWIRKVAENAGIFLLEAMTNSTFESQSNAFYKGMYAVSGAFGHGVISGTDLETGEEGFLTKSFREQLESQASVNEDIAARVEQMKKLNSEISSASALGTGIGELAGIATLIAEGIATGGMVSDIASGLIPAKLTKGLVSASAGAKTVATEIQAAAGLYSMADIGLKSMAMPLFVNTVNTAIGVVVKGIAAGAAAAVVPLASELAVDSIVDTVLCDPELTSRFLANTDDEEARAYVLENLAQDAEFSLAIRGGIKGWQFAANKIPVVGRLNAALTKLSMKIRVGLANITDAVSEKLPGKTLAEKAELYKARLEASTNSFQKIRWNNKLSAVQNEQQMKTLNKNLREKASQVASASSYDEFKDLLVEYQQLQNLTDAIKDSVRWNLSRLRSTPGVGSALSDVDDSISKLNKALRKEGVQFKKNGELLKAGEAGRQSSLFGLDQKTSDYISAVIDREHILSYERKYSKLGKAMSEQLEADEAFIENFNKYASRELKEAADEAIPRIYNFWYNYMDYATSPEFAIYNRAEIIEDRASGLWGTETKPTYAMLQRKTDEYIPHSMRIKAEANTRSEMGGLFEREYGSGEHYKDPFVTIYNTIIGDSKEIVLKEYMNAIDSIPGIFKSENKLISAEQSELARKTKKTVKTARDKVSSTTSIVVKESSNFTTDSVNKYTKTYTEVKIDAKDAEKEPKKANRELDKLKNRSTASIEKSRVTDTQVSDTVSGMDINRKQQIAAANGMNPDDFRDVNNGDLKNMVAIPENYRTGDIENMITAASGDVTVSEFLTTFYQARYARDEGYAELFKEWLETLPDKTQKKIKTAVKSELAEGLDDSEKKALTSRLRKSGLTADDAVQALDKSFLRSGGVDSNTLQHKIDSIILKDTGSEYLLRNKAATEKLATTKEAKIQARYEAHNARVAEAEGVAREANEALDAAMDEAGLVVSQEATYDSIDEMIDSVVDEIDHDSAAHQAFGATGGTDADRRNFIITELGLDDNLEEFFNAMYDAHYKSVREIVATKYSGVKTTDEVDTIANKIAESYANIAVQRLQSRAARARVALQTNGSPFADSTAMFDEAKKLNREITGISGDITGGRDNTVVRFLDDQGREEFYEVSPAIADLINTTPTSHIDTGFESFKKATVSLFRMGTTGFLNLTSYTNQFARDFADALINAGAYRTSKTMNKVIENAFGSNFARTVRDWQPEDLLKYGDTEATQAEKIFETQKKIGYGRSSSSTEYTAYRFASNRRIASLEAGEFRGIEAQDDIRTWSQKVSDKLSEISDNMNKLHDIRERGLRERVFSNSYAKAISNGYTAKQANIIATFNMQNATTNFARSLVHFDNLRKSIPYLGSAINGAKSFYRIFELDPIGVGTRIVGGVIVPMVALTGQSLSSEENRKVYEQIPEWQKESSLTFVVEGQVYTIPLPEQIASLMTPWRQIVEYCYKANKGTFMEMLTSDIVGLSPIDFSGFTSIDIANLYTDDNEMWKERAKLGLTRVISQVVDPITKSAIMAFTGYDPYTNTKIDKSRVSIDEDGNAIIVDSGAGKTMSMLRDMVSNATNGEWVISASMAQALLQNVIGKGGVALADSLLTLGGGVVDSATTGDWSNLGQAVLSTAVETPIKQITSPLTYDAYDQSLRAWKDAVRYLYNKKDALLERQDVQKILEQLSTETDPDKIAKLKAQRDDIVDAYQEEVLKVVNNLKSRFPESTFNTSKFYTVVGLLNMNSNSKQQNWYAETALSKSVSSEEKQQGKMDALNTMVKMGFPDIEGQEVLGYVKNNYGQIEVTYANPLSILAYESTKSQQKDIVYANVKALRDNNDWYELRNAMYNQLNVIRNSKDKLTSSDYDEMSAIQSDYNRQIMKDLASVIANTSPEQLVGSSETMSILRDYIIVPYSSRGTVNNKYADVPGNVSDAYIENYIKAILKVNDTKYASGSGDWSGRGQWWKEQ